MDAGPDAPRTSPNDSAHDGDGGGGSGGGGGSPVRKVRPLVAKLDRVQRRNRPLGFLYGVIKKFGEDDAGGLAALIAYYGFFSLFPLLLALTSILGWVVGNDAELRQKVLDSALTSFPVIGDQIRDNVGSLRGSGLAFVIGFVTAIWAGLGVMNAIQRAMNKVWDVPIRERPNFLETRVRGMVMLGIFGLALLVITVASSATAFFGPAASIAAIVVSWLLDAVLLLAVFRVLTDRDLDMATVLPGAVVGGLVLAALQVVGGAYVRNSVQGASDTYGTFAIVIGLLTWLYLLAQVFVLAAEINVVKARQLWPRSLPGSDDLTDADHHALARHARVEERHAEEQIGVDIEGRPIRRTDRATTDR